MRVDLLELLHCPGPHGATPLVIVAHARDGERLMQGVLGCPACGAEYPLNRGSADLRVEKSAARLNADGGAKTPDSSRVAALLGLTEPDMRVALCGAYAAVAGDLETLAEARCVAVNAASDVHPGPDAPAMTAGVDHLQVDVAGQLPMAAGTLHALAIDSRHATLLLDAPRVVRAGGRILATVTAALPAGCRELARDAHEWVAVVDATPSTPVMLRRGSAYGG